MLDAGHCRGARVPVRRPTRPGRVTPRGRGLAHTLNCGPLVTDISSLPCDSDQRELTGGPTSQRRRSPTLQRPCRRQGGRLPPDPYGRIGPSRDAAEVGAQCPGDDDPCHFHVPLSRSPGPRAEVGQGGPSRHTCFSTHGHPSRAPAVHELRSPWSRSSKAPTSPESRGPASEQRQTGPIDAAVSPHSDDGSQWKTGSVCPPTQLIPAYPRWCELRPASLRRLTGCVDPPHPRAAQPAPPIATPRSTLIP